MENCCSVFSLCQSNSRFSSISNIYFFILFTNDSNIHLLREVCFHFYSIDVSTLSLSLSMNSFDHVYVVFVCFSSPPSQHPDTHRFVECLLCYFMPFYGILSRLFVKFFGLLALALNAIHLRQKLFPNGYTVTVKRECPLI